ncbi:MAG: hypothetical protein IJS12_03220 [Lachnospiraceae bacterium]|nr:hypothetical protein [Lachnospiraceae bacterium]
MKVNIRSVSFWLMTVLMALALILMRRVIGQYSADTVVLLYAPDAVSSGSGEQTDSVSSGHDMQPDEFTAGEWCCRYLSEHTPEGFVYEPVDSEDQLISRVSTGDVSCGVIFGEDANARIYQTAGSVDGYVVREMVYPIIAEYLAEDDLNDYVHGSYPALSEDVLSGRADEAAAYVAERYREHMDELDLEIYEIRDISKGRADGWLNIEADAGSTAESEAESRAGRLERLIFAIMLAGVCGLCIYDTAYTDRTFYRAFSAGKRILLAGAQVLITNVMVAGIAFVLAYALR